MGDDLVPNYGGTDFFEMPKERIEEEQHEQGVLSTAVPFLIDVDEWWNAQIEDANHNSHIDPNLPISIEAQWYAGELLRQKLIDKQGEWAELAQSLREDM